MGVRCVLSARRCFFSGTIRKKKKKKKCTRRVFVNTSISHEISLLWDGIVAGRRFNFLDDRLPYECVTGPLAMREKRSIACAIIRGRRVYYYKTYTHTHTHNTVRVNYGLTPFFALLSAPRLVLCLLLKNITTTHVFGSASFVTRIERVHY